MSVIPFRRNTRPTNLEFKLWLALCRTRNSLSTLVDSTDGHTRNTMIELVDSVLWPIVYSDDYCNEMAAEQAARGVERMPQWDITRENDPDGVGAALARGVTGDDVRCPRCGASEQATHAPFCQARDGTPRDCSFDGGDDAA